MGVKWNKVKKGLARRGRIIFYISCLFTVTGFGGRIFMLFELTSHFRVQYFFVFLIAAILFGWKKKWLWLGTALFFGAVNGAVIVPWYIPAGGVNLVTGGQDLRILFAPMAI